MTPLTAGRLLALLDVLAEAGVQVWLDGGWGVDALLGAQHRQHEDADLVVRLGDLDRLEQALQEHGFAVAEDHLPTRLVLRTPAGEQLDLHPVRFDEHGDGWQVAAAADGGDARYPADQFTTGAVRGRSVPCLGPEVQLAHHSGYSPRPRDVEDVQRLTARFGLAVPPGYPGADGGQPAGVPKASQKASAVSDRPSVT